jgi:hypothetical protein
VPRGPIVDTLLEKGIAVFAIHPELRERSRIREELAIGSVYDERWTWDLRTSPNSRACHAAEPREIGAGLQADAATWRRFLQADAATRFAGSCSHQQEGLILSFAGSCRQVSAASAG